MNNSPICSRALTRGGLEVIYQQYRASSPWLIKREGKMDVIVLLLFMTFTFDRCLFMLIIYLLYLAAGE